MTIGTHEYKNQNRLKINLLTPFRLSGSKLIFFALRQLADRGKRRTEAKRSSTKSKSMNSYL
jgi:hypothetical protein